MDSSDVKKWKTNLLRRGRSFPSVELKSTLRKSSSPPGSPAKYVTFADDNNLSLVEIRKFIPSNDNLNLWAESSYFQQQYKLSMFEREESEVIGSQKRTFKKRVELALCFNEPCQSADFLERYKHRCVALEKCETRDRTIIGMVLVKNIDFHKNVFVRYTIDNWKSSSDIDAVYVPNSNEW